MIGGGFGGLKVARRLARRDLDITLIDRVNHHLFQPLLYQVGTGILAGGQIAPALRDLFVARENVRVVLAEVEAIDLQARTVTAAARDLLTLPYDMLVVAAGARDSYFGHNEWERDAPGMKSLDDAFRIRTRILSAFELAETASSAAEQDAWLTFVIVCAGPTGVELAGQIAYLSRHTLAGHYRTIRSEDARIVLLDAAATVLPSFRERLQGKAAAELRRLGIEIRVETTATNVDAHGIDLRTPDGADRIEAHTVLWAAGVEASPLARLLADASGAAVDRSGRVAVAPDLTLPGHPEVFALGDMVALDAVPGVAQAALQEGAYVAKVIASRIERKPAPDPFHYRDKGSLAIVGRSWAVADIRGLQLAGRRAWVIWAVVHIAFLVDWQKRLEIVRRWFWEFVTHDRHDRVISYVSLLPDELARAEVESVRRRIGRGESGDEASDQ
ncbi:MAG TPA: NAD(P)/FAD-dependent oxidoreductase [Solirubrobacteraceae bacterium]|nr:NAD(P)/FAD-dependent oxidoreductase [Solirubrobacteraceae bacterium]